VWEFFLPLKSARRNFDIKIDERDSNSRQWSHHCGAAAEQQDGGGVPV